MKRLAVAVVSLMMASVVHSENWYKVGSNSTERIDYFIDIDSVKKTKIPVIPSGEYIQVIVQPTFLKGSKFREIGRYYSKELWVISCDNNSNIANAKVDYGTNNEVMNSWQNKTILYLNSFDYNFPGTLGGNVVETSCRIFENGGTLGRYKLEDILNGTIRP